MSNSERLSFAIIEHLTQQLDSGTVSGDSAESLEVAIQCLEQVFNINRGDEAQLKRLKTERSLQEIFDTAENLQTNGGATSMHPTAQDRQKAEELKNEGNQLMKEEKFQEAINSYSRAIELDNTNSVYPCNRAAAYSKLGEHQKAIEDCQRAIKLDPRYGKAFGRMGLSYQSINNLEKAKESYIKAIEMEPDNVFYKNNLSLVESKLQEGQAQRGSAGSRPQAAMPNPAGMPNLGGLDFASLLSNPAVMNMAQTFMQNPQIQQMVGNMMGGAGGGGGASGGGMTNLFQAAQSFGDQMQQTNPELFEQLRTQAQASMGTSTNTPEPTNEEKESEEK
ncbi:small glutamine-rich tetratricopeptide repeat-containing protein alpha [Nematostella vectensis]|uniref:small glutamine-rich tetratricopeptide repeat-containing protein alpha n=1 Tax=Nematostella vectensis TaxID=45351 RepID=UPI0013900354|nr:small glutamine-rich tetratricopeptide repeat-containing protein alpha [Nematostella vectensis]